MTKEQEIMKFLHSHVFDPILNSPDSSAELRKGTNLTIARMEKRDAAGMIHFYWAAIAGTDRSIKFADQMRQEGFTRFEDVFEEFRVRFNDDWLRS